MVVSPAQMESLPVISTTGSGSTVTVPVAGWDGHPFPPVTTTVYCVVVSGETVIDCVVSPVLHRNVNGPTPDRIVAVRTAESPSQIVSLFTLTSGAELMLIWMGSIKSFNAALIDCEALVFTMSVLISMQESVPDTTS